MIEARLFLNDGLQVRYEELMEKEREYYALLADIANTPEGYSLYSKLNSLGVELQKLREDFVNKFTQVISNSKGQTYDHTSGATSSKESSERKHTAASLDNYFFRTFETCPRKYTFKTKDGSSKQLTWQDAIRQLGFKDINQDSSSDED